MRKTLTAIACTAAILGWTASAAANPEKHPTEHPKDGEHKGGEHKDGHDGDHKDGHGDGEHKDGHGSGHPGH
jgi:Spy/CpxP family protein refolding chaperone